MEINEYNINNLLSEGVPLLNSRLTSLKNMDDATYFGFLILNIINYYELNVDVRIVLERLLNKLISELYIYEIICYYSDFYYLPTQVYNKQIKKISRAINKSNNLIDIFRLRIQSNNVTGDSDDKYFFDRGLDKLLKAIENFFVYNVDDYFNKMGMYFLFLNYVQTIAEYELNKDKQRMREVNLTNIIEKIDMLFFSIEPLMKEVIKNNDKLYFFNLYVKDKYNKVFEKTLDVVRDSETTRIQKASLDNVIWIYNNLLDIYPNEYNVKYSVLYETLSGYYLTRFKERTILEMNFIKSNPGQKINLTIPIFEEYKSRAWFNISDYFKNYIQSASTDIDDIDRAKVIEMNDEKLRQAVARIIYNISPQIIAKESIKPHGAFEISDMELPISYCGETYYICMPFKSGQEIKGDKKVSENYIYQVLKPFISFSDKAIVVFISAKEATQNFENDIKILNTKQLFKIDTIMGDDLIKLLKYNSII